MLIVFNHELKIAIGCKLPLSLAASLYGGLSHVHASRLSRLASALADSLSSGSLSGSDSSGRHPRVSACSLALGSVWRVRGVQRRDSEASAV